MAWLWVWIGLGLLGLAIFDQIMLWAERRGWVYWRRSQGRRGRGMGGAFIAMQTGFSPDAQHIGEAKAGKKQEERDNGDQEDTKG